MRRKTAFVHIEHTGTLIAVAEAAAQPFLLQPFSVFVPRLLWRLSCSNIGPSSKKGSNDNRRLCDLAFNGISHNQRSGWVGQWLCESCRPRFPQSGSRLLESLVHVEVNGECLNRIWQKLGLDTAETWNSSLSHHWHGSHDKEWNVGHKSWRVMNIYESCDRMI